MSPPKRKFDLDKAIELQQPCLFATKSKRPTVLMQQSEMRGHDLTLRFGFY